jgi:hypothetical protein
MFILNDTMLYRTIWASFHNTSNAPISSTQNWEKPLSDRLPYTAGTCIHSEQRHTKSGLRYSLTLQCGSTDRIRNNSLKKYNETISSVNGPVNPSRKGLLRNTSPFPSQTTSKQVPALLYFQAKVKEKLWHRGCLVGRPRWSCRRLKAGSAWTKGRLGTTLSSNSEQKGGCDEYAGSLWYRSVGSRMSRVGGFRAMQAS